MKRLVVFLIVLLVSSTITGKIDMLKLESMKKSLKFAWIEGSKTVRVVCNQDVDEHKILLFDTSGNELKIASLKRDHNNVWITLVKKMDFINNVFARYEEEEIFAYFSVSVLNEFFYYSGSDLGATLIEDQLQLKLWSPSATSVRVNIYDKDASMVLAAKDLVRKKFGIWQVRIDPKEFSLTSFENCFYQYEVTAFGKTQKALDPYAKSMASFDPKGEDRIGMGAIVKLDIPKISRKSSVDMANELDFVAYEAHIRDFTIDHGLELAKPLRGTYEGFKVVIPYIKELGVTHVQFMPLQNFYTVKEHIRAYQGEKVPKENINYNWGYDPHNYFTPEGWYSMEPFKPMSRINEIKSLFERLHKNGIGVILDVVYNHIYHHTLLENAAPGCYLRRNTYGEISEGTGAGVTFESRILMGRKLIVDSLLFWHNFYGVDGFRFDLMGFMDHETMIEIRKALGNKVILYGEAWNFTDLPHEDATTKNNLPEKAKLSVFNDSSRDSYTGRMSKKGFVQGNFKEIYRAKSGIVAGLKAYPNYYGDMSDNAYDRYASVPAETINYLTIHDGFTLWDKINLTTKGDANRREKLVKMSLAMLMTSQGKVILHGGCEMARSKPLRFNDPNPHRAHTSENIDSEYGVEYFHENTYNSPDTTSKIDWERAEEFLSLKKYLKGLIKLRRSLPALRYLNANSVKNGLKFIKRRVDGGSIKALGESAGYDTFQDSRLSELTIYFKNAPNSVRNRRIYVTGEVHPKTSESKNPVENQFYVDIDDLGMGTVRLTRKNIINFDLTAWSSSQDLAIKLVKNSGSWEFPEGSYSEYGHNTITPRSILKGNSVVIDLGIQDHYASDIRPTYNKYIAYSLDNSLELDVATRYERLRYKNVVVVHNADDKDLVLEVPLIKTVSNWDVLVDMSQAGPSAITNSSIKIDQGLVTVPAKSSTVLGGNE